MTVRVLVLWCSRRASCPSAQRLRSSTTRRHYGGVGRAERGTSSAHALRPRRGVVVARRRRSRPRHTTESWSTSAVAEPSGRKVSCSTSFNRKLGAPLRDHLHLRGFLVNERSVAPPEPGTPPHPGVVAASTGRARARRAPARRARATRRCLGRGRRSYWTYPMSTLPRPRWKRASARRAGARASVGPAGFPHRRSRRLPASVPRLKLVDGLRGAGSRRRSWSR